MKLLLIPTLPILAIKGSTYLGEVMNPPGLAWTLGGFFAAACIFGCVLITCKALRLD